MTVVNERLYVIVTGKDGLFLPAQYCKNARIREGSKVYVDVHGTDMLIGTQKKYGLREHIEVLPGFRLLPDSGLVRAYIDFLANNKNANLHYSHKNGLAGDLLGLQLHLSKLKS